MTEDWRQVYAEAVWNAFLERTGGTRLMGPVEFSLVRHWMDQGFPLRVVLRAIHETGKPGRTLMYYEPSVEASMKRHESAL
jgi:hypothetical protein